MALVSGLLLAGTLNIKAIVEAQGPRAYGLVSSRR